MKGKSYLNKTDNVSNIKLIYLFLEPSTKSELLSIYVTEPFWNISLNIVYAEIHIFLIPGFLKHRIWLTSKLSYGIRDSD